MINPSKLNLSLLPSVPLEQRSQLPSTPCIYFAIDSQGIIQYIGKTKNLRTRWRAHDKGIELSAMNGVRIAYLETDADLLLEVEAALISWFAPPLNTRRWIKPKEARTSCFQTERVIRVDAPGIGAKIKEAREDPRIEKLRVEELPFVALDGKQLLPQEPCVYFVLDGQGKVLYIGQSENLMEKWSSHHKLAAMMQLEGVKISFLKTDIDLLRRVEIALIEAFKPPLNEVTAKIKGISRLREQAGLTQKEVAKALGVDISTIRNWEYGKGSEMFVRVARLCELLKCQPNDLSEVQELNAGDP